MSSDNKTAPTEIADDDLDQAQGGLSVGRLAMTTTVKLDNVQRVSGAGVSPFLETGLSDRREAIDEPTGRVGANPTPHP